VIHFPASRPSDRLSFYLRRLHEIATNWHVEVTGIFDGRRVRVCHTDDIVELEKSYVIDWGGRP
jgi:hypothetical protein